MTQEKRAILYVGKGPMPGRHTQEFKDSYDGDYHSLSDARDEGDRLKHKGRIHWYVVFDDDQWFCSWSSK